MLLLLLLPLVRLTGSLSLSLPLCLCVLQHLLVIYVHSEADSEEFDLSLFRLGLFEFGCGGRMTSQWNDWGAISDDDLNHVCARQVAFLSRCPRLRLSCLIALSLPRVALLSLCSLCHWRISCPIALSYTSGSLISLLSLSLVALLSHCSLSLLALSGCPGPLRYVGDR
jgi:hypothetical protein